MKKVVNISQRHVTKNTHPKINEIIQLKYSARKCNQTWENINMKRSTEGVHSTQCKADQDNLRTNERKHRMHLNQQIAMYDL